MNDCCSSVQATQQTFHNMLKSVLESKVINVEVLSVAVGILFIIVMLKNKFCSFSGT